jgi:nicotinamide riboside transporter PnuC
MQVWSWILAVGGITAMWLVGQHNKLGWLIGAALQVVWFVFAVITHQYGFIATAIVYSFVYARNWYRWRRLERDVAAQSQPTPEKESVVT